MLSSQEKQALELDLAVGDILLGGRFRNRRIKVEELGTDDLGQPTVNGRKLLNYRIEKLLPPDKRRKGKPETDKQADEDYTMPARLAGWGAALGAVGLTTLWGRRLRQRYAELQQRTPNIRGVNRQRLLSAAGLPEDYPLLPMPGLANAALIASPGEFKEFTGLPLDREQFRQLLGKYHGGVLYDPQHGTAGTLGHELGHAMQEHRWGPRKVVNRLRRWAPPLRWAAAIGSVAALISDKPGLAAAFATGGMATSLPTLISEYDATRTGRRLTAELPLKKNTRELDRDIDRTAFKSYLAEAIKGGATFAPLLAVSAARLAQKARV